MVAALGQRDAGSFWLRWIGALQSAMIDALSHFVGDSEGRTFGGRGRPKLIEVPPGPGDFQLRCNEDDAVSVLQKVGGYWGKQANRFS
eukprot:12835795-Alexandrium_andersonii.AAC.1